MKKLTQIISLSLALSFSGIANANLIQDLLKETNEKVYKIEKMNEHKAVLSIFRDIEFKEGFVEIDYQEAKLTKDNIPVIKTVYLLEKEKLEYSKPIIKKLGLDIEKLEENKDYELTLNYIYGYKAHFKLTEYVSG